MALALLASTLGGFQGGLKIVKAHENPDSGYEYPELILKYDEPGTEWESQALPMGNGSIGAMVFGGVESEKLQINESSIWSGGPGANPYMTAVLQTIPHSRYITLCRHAEDSFRIWSMILRQTGQPAWKTEG